MNSSVSHNGKFESSLLTDAFPFHIVVENNDEISAVGSSLKRVLPELSGELSTLHSYFTMDQPKCGASFDELLANKSKLFLLRSISNSELVLRAQVLISDDETSLALLAAVAGWFGRLKPAATMADSMFFT